MTINSNILAGGGLADPHAIVENGRVYIFCGQDKSPKTEDTWRMTNWNIFSSDNLIDWKKEGEILPNDTYMTDYNNCWAGYITKRNDIYYWFFSNKNFDIGVMTSKNICGPYKDALLKPLIPQNFCPTNSYDPCVFEENDVSTIFFGAGKYYGVKLSDDLLSTVGKPFPISVQDENKNEVMTDDKCTFFKHKSHYYLAFGSKYAISDNLYGPYKFMGEFIGGGHNDFFEFKGKTYICNEFHDTNIFYRGIRVIECNFADDGRVILPEKNEKDVKNGKTFDFKNGNPRWFLTNFEDAQLDLEGVHFPLSKEIGLRSPVFSGVVLDKNFTVTVNHCIAKSNFQLSLRVHTVENGNLYWSSDEYKIFEKTIDIINSSSNFSCNFDNYDNLLLKKIELYIKNGDNTKDLTIENINIFTN